MQGIRKAFEKMLDQERISQREAAKRIGQKSPVLNRKLVQESMRYNEAEEIADFFGYDIEWVKREEQK